MKTMSNIVYGVWRIDNLDYMQIYNNLVELRKLGINTIDTADIYHIKKYGDSERLIGKALSQDESLKEYFKIVTKCGIRINDGFQDIKFYDNTFEYIIKQAKESIKNLQVKKINLLLLHRPNMFMKYEEVYEAFKYLKEKNMVENFGVSNYTPIEFESLYIYLEKRGIKLVTNQIEINPLSKEHIDNDNIYYLKGREIQPMIWSPMAGGKVFEKSPVYNTLLKIANRYDVSIMNIVISYINGMGLNSKIILGSHKISRYKEVVEHLDLEISKSEMFEILESSRGYKVP